jgi:hypothetical protein
MPKYALSATGKVPGDRIKITCKVCGRLSLCGKEEDPKSMKCDYCGHDFGKKVQSYIDDTPNASSDTHNRYSWFCSGCEHRGLKWVLKMTPFSACPNCDAPLPSHMNRPINPDKGLCKTIWEPVETESIDPPKPATIATRKCGTCRTCGHKYYYRVSPPFRCDNCGEDHKHPYKMTPPSTLPPKPERGRNKYIDCSACGFHHSMHLLPPEVCAACGHPFSKIAEVQS